MAEANVSEQRRIPACQRCRLRKTKCDSQVPSCSNCVKAGVECVNYDKILGRAWARSYVRSMEDKKDVTPDKEDSVSALVKDNGKIVHEEVSLHQAPRKHRKSTMAESVNNAQDLTGKLYAATSDPSSRQKNGECIHYYQPDPKKRRKSSDREVQVSASSSTLDDSSSYSDSDNEDSDHNLNLLLGSSVQGDESTHLSENIASEIRRYSNSNQPEGGSAEFIAKENWALAKLGKDFLKVARKNMLRNRTTDITAYDSSILRRVTKRYFSWMNSAYPVLHEINFHEVLEKCQTNAKNATKFEIFQVKMVIAVSLASLSRSHLSTSALGQFSREFRRSATQMADRGSRKLKDIKHLQNVLLRLQYSLFDPKSGDIWQLSGSAMRLATDMGLFSQENPTQNFDPLTLDLRRRLFWTCYCIDRTLSTTMGRPTSIPDSWITMKLPSLVEDKCITSEGISQGPMCCLKLALVHHVRICRLQSMIHSRLYAPAFSIETVQTNQKTWTWQVYDQLRTWRSSFLYPTPLVTKEWTELQFHIAVVLLLRPSPNRPKPSDEELHVAFHSAGEAMKLVKVMHRDVSAVFSWQTVQNLFMCGLTFINSLKELTQDHRSNTLCISFMDVILQVQACTSILETLSTLEGGDHEKLRNVFEIASSVVLHELAIKTSNLQSPGYRGGRCVWDLLAKSDDLTLQRPVNIDNQEIPVQSNCGILGLTDMPDLISFPVDEAHFYEHDVDASRFEVGRTQIEKGIHNTRLELDGSFSELTPTKNNNTRTPYQLPSRNQTARPSIAASGSNPEMAALTAFSTIASEADPLSATDLPEWIDTNPGAEFERWFLYPI